MLPLSALHLPAINAHTDTDTGTYSVDAAIALDVAIPIEY